MKRAFWSLRCRVTAIAGAVVYSGLAPVLLAEEAGGQNSLPPFLQPNAYLAIWTIIVFGLLLWVLSKFAWKPLLNALQAREEHVRKMISDAEQARDQAKAFLMEHERKMAEVQNEVRAIIEEARRDAQHTKEDIVKQAQADAEDIRDRAKRDIERARDQALKALFDQTALLATDVASRIIRRSLKPDDHRDLVQQALQELPSKN